MAAWWDGGSRTVNRLSTRLAHPPFTFGLGGFRPGTLLAVGYIAGLEVARHAVRTPGPIERLTVTLDLAGRPVARTRPGPALLSRLAP